VQPTAFLAVSWTDRSKVIEQDPECAKRIIECCKRLFEPPPSRPLGLERALSIVPASALIAASKSDDSAVHTRRKHSLTRAVHNAFRP
jgi:hypothetical protein